MQMVWGWYEGRPNAWYVNIWVGFLSRVDLQVWGWVAWSSLGCSLPVWGATSLVAYCSGSAGTGSTVKYSSSAHSSLCVLCPISLLSTSGKLSPLSLTCTLRLFSLSGTSGRVWSDLCGCYMSLMLIRVSLRLTYRLYLCVLKSSPYRYSQPVSGFLVIRRVTAWVPFILSLCI